MEQNLQTINKGFSAIEQELERILDSRLFRSSPLLSRFLAYVVNKTIEGKEHQIKEYSIGLDVLGKSGDFQEKPDASVRINAVRLRKLLEEYYQQTSIPPLVRIELPKGSYRPFFAKNGHEGLPETEQTSVNKGVKSSDNICIIPFKALLSHEALNFSVNGFCEYLSEKLTLFQDITVVGYHSIKMFLDEGGQLEQLHENFGIRYYLTGSIDLSPRFLLISIELMDAESGILIWSDHIQTPMQESNAFTNSVKQVAEKIVASLAGYSGMIHFKKYANVNTLPDLNNKVANAVFWFYLYNIYHTHKHFTDAIQGLEAIVSEDDQSSSLCFAVLAHLYTDSIFYNYATPTDPIEKTGEYIAKAMELDPHQQHAYLAKAWLEIITQQWEKAQQSADTMLAINPNSAYFVGIYSLGYAMFCDFETSLHYWQKAIQLNPLPYWWLNVPMFIFHLKTDNYKEALFYARKNTTPKGIYEYILELIALYYLQEKNQLLEIKKIHCKKFPGQLAFVTRTFPLIFRDEKIKGKLSKALEAIHQL
jgi:TolB-like protein